MKIFHRKAFIQHNAGFAARSPIGEKASKRVLTQLTRLDKHFIMHPEISRALSFPDKHFSIPPGYAQALRSGIKNSKCG